jgi:hypothetical protein
MRQVILVARDDDGQPCSNGAWADQVRYLAGVEHVDVVSIDTVISDPARVFPLVTGPWPDAGLGPDFVVPNGVGARPGEIGPVAINGAETVRAGSGFVVGPLEDGLMFASTKQADVDAYLERQHDRMGHTEVTRG